MTTEARWRRYAQIWSSAPEVRSTELEACLAEDCTYCDVNGLLSGRDALSSYMGEFQQNVTDGRFEILSVLNHHDRMLAEWRLLGSDGTVLQTGRSFASVASDGRLQHITGFFDPADKARAA